MSIVTKIISIVFKSVVDNKISNKLAKELIGVSIDEASEVGINKIKDFINEEKAKIDHILSRDNLKFMNIPEKNIDYVIVEIKNMLSNVDITDEVLRKCKYDSNNLNDFLWNEYCRHKGNNYIEYESYIKYGIFAVAKAVVEIIRESKDFEKDVLINIMNSVDNLRLEEQTKSYDILKRFDKLDESNQTIIDRISENMNIHNDDKIQKGAKSRTKYYAQKWSENMFLNNFNKRDENAGVNIMLKDVYVEYHLPHYKWKKNKKISDDLKTLLDEYVDEHSDNKMLLILGQPGIGKSTLITYITANFKKNTNKMLVYKFAPDLRNVDWQNESEKYDIVYDIIKTLNLSYKILNGKVMILDGFDEIALKHRAEILNKLYYKLVRECLLCNFSLIITCRENYIYNLNSVSCDYITLQPWDEGQIQSFCKIYQKKVNSNFSRDTLINILQNRNILGVPLILYMVLALNICIDKKASIVDVYDQIFALDGGIYDRSIKNNRYATPHRIQEIKMQIHQISLDIAVWMFVNEPDTTCIPQKEYEKIYNKVMKNEIRATRETVQDILIGNYFRMVCDGIGTEEVYFVHRSIYEYFVAEYIYTSFINAIGVPKEKLAGILGRLFECTILSEEIVGFLKHKINNSRYYGIADVINKTFNLMLEKGMVAFTNERYIKNIINYEMNVFINMLEIIHLYENYNFSNKQFIIGYLKYNNQNKLNLRNFNLSEADLSRVDLHECDLRNIDLRGASLKYAILVFADLREADLREADLIGASLHEANLDGANLDGAIFDEYQIPVLENKYDLKKSKVYVYSEDKVFSYNKFYRMKKDIQNYRNTKVNYVLGEVPKQFSARI